jgi:hypothetical protein
MTQAKIQTHTSVIQDYNWLAASWADPLIAIIHGILELAFPAAIFVGADRGSGEVWFVLVPRRVWVAGADVVWQVKAFHCLILPVLY